MKKVYIVILFCLILLTGCNTSLDHLEEDDDIISEYMANLLLTHQEKNKEKDDNDITKDDGNKKDDNDATKDDGNKKDDTSIDDKKTDNNAKSHNLSEFKIKKDLELAFKDYKLYKSYPETKESYFTLKPRDNYELLVVNFSLYNKSEKKVKLNFTKELYKYKININNDLNLKPLLTLLEDDLQYLDKSIAPNKSIDVVLVFEVEKKQKVNSLELEVNKQEKVTKYLLK